MACKVRESGRPIIRETACSPVTVSHIGTEREFLNPLSSDPAPRRSRTRYSFAERHVRLFLYRWSRYLARIDRLHVLEYFFALVLDVSPS